MLKNITQPHYKLTVPSTKLNVTVRPFMVAEEKILLTAKEASNMQAFLMAVSQVVNSCVVEPKDFDIETLTMFDVEFLFIKLRALSVKNTIEFQVTQEDNSKYNFVVNLDDIQVPELTTTDSLVELSPTHSIKLRYPTIKTIKQASTLQETRRMTEAEAVALLIANSIDQIIQGDEIIKAEDVTLEELVGWIDQNISVAAHHKINAFLETMPQMNHTITYKYGNEDKTMTLTGLRDFFFF